MDTNAAHSVIAALSYAQNPGLNFARLVSDLDAALDSCPHDRRALHWDCDDLALFDLDGTRIALAGVEAGAGTGQAVLTVSVGPSGQDATGDPLAVRRDAVCRLIADRISARIPADTVLWAKSRGVMTPEKLDALGEELLHQTEQAAAVPAAQTALVPEGKDIADDVLERLVARMETELRTNCRTTDSPRQTTKRSASDTLASVAPMPSTMDAAGPDIAKPACEAAGTTTEPVENAVANDLPDIPHPMVFEARRLRDALYPNEAPKTAAFGIRIVRRAQSPASTPMRIAVGTMSAAMVLVASPLGAALIVYNTLGGADVRTTARAIALTGALFGLAELPVVRAALATI